MEHNLEGLEYDLLTGLYSRWYCHVELQRILDNRENCVFCSLDLNGFRRLNQEYGDKKGDELLKAIGKALLKIEGLILIGIIMILSLLAEAIRSSLSSVIEFISAI